MINHHEWRKGIVTALAALAFGLVLATAVGAAEITDANLDEHIAAAKTAADQEALAAYFRGLAAKEGERVKQHEAMLAVYSGGGNERYGYMLPHCRTAIAKAKELQQSYLEMAKFHEDLAKGAGK